MKHFMRLLMIVILQIAIAGCAEVVYVHHHHKGKKIPPGHAKKMTGSKSAKPYAPGQKK